MEEGQLLGPMRGTLCLDASDNEHSFRPLPWTQYQEDRSSRKTKAPHQMKLTEQQLFPPPMERRMNLLVMGMDGLAEQVIRELRVSALLDFLRIERNGSLLLGIPTQRSLPTSRHHL